MDMDMASPIAILPYPYYDYTEIESLLNFDDNVDGIFEDVSDPFVINTTYGDCVYHTGTNDFEAGLSEVVAGETSNQDEQNLQNLIPVSNVPFSCISCQVLREITHNNGNHTTKLEIHGGLGLIRHAILDDQHDVNATALERNNNHMHDFSNKSIEDVKQYLVQYCEDRKNAGYILVRDPLLTFYESLCVGPSWDDNLTFDDFLEQSPLHAVPPEGQLNPTVTEIPAVAAAPRTSLSAQRRRTGLMKLADLAKYFNIPIEAAARQIGVCASVVKNVCRKENLKRWPYRKVKSLEKKMAKLKEGLSTTDLVAKARIEAEIATMDQEMVNVCAGLRPE